MAKLGRVLQKIFGVNATTGGVGVGQMSEIGSFAAGSATTESPTDAGALAMQGLSNYLGGWFSCIAGGNSPVIEDMNSLHFLITRQLAEIFQDGVPPYENTTTYYQGSIVNISGILFVCVNDNSGAGIVGESPSAYPANWSVLTSSNKNYLLNAAYDYWQRGTSFTVPNGSSTNTFVYTADRWAADTLNLIVASTVSQVAGTISGSKYGIEIVSTGGSGSEGVALVCMLSNRDSIDFYNGNAYFQTNIKAVGNVTGVVANIVYATSETNVAQNLVFLGGSGVTASVNTSGFVVLQISGQAVGTLMTTAGVVGVYIQASTVSSGHAYDSGNGFILEQSYLNPYGQQSKFSRAYSLQETEISALEAYFEKSFDLTQTPGNNLNVTGFNQWSAITSSAANSPSIQFKTRKRTATPLINLYDPKSATANACYDFTASVAVAATPLNSSASRFVIAPTGYSGSAGNTLYGHWTADGELY